MDSPIPVGEQQPSELRPNELRPSELRPNELRPNELRPNELRPSKQQCDDRELLHLRAATERAGKCYGFDDQHDPEQPIDFWFQEAEEGRVLFVVFYTLACQWSSCSGCNLPSLSASRPVPLASLVRQVDALFAKEEIKSQLPNISKLIVSNNGSVLDEATFPTSALLYLMVQVNLLLPRLRVVTLESRPEYVDLLELGFLSRVLREREEPAVVEIAIGLEAFDEQIRNQWFRKGLSLSVLETLVERMASLTPPGGTPPSGLRLKCYFMQKPVAGLTDDAAVEDVEKGIEYLDQLSRRFRVPISLHLNPTYVARGSALEAAFRAGDYRPPLLADVARAVLHARGTSLSVFVGLSDEGLAVPGGTFVRPGDDRWLRQFTAFNRSQDYALLQSVGP